MNYAIVKNGSKPHVHPSLAELEEKVMALIKTVPGRHHGLLGAYVHVSQMLDKNAHLQFSAHLACRGLGHHTKWFEGLWSKTLEQDKQTDSSE